MILISKHSDVNGKSKTWNWFLLNLIILFVLLIRIRLLNFPLERDEGEYAYLGQLILQGIPPYSMAYNMKFPGTYFIYAVIMAMFGQTISAIHFGLLLVNCGSLILIFLLSKKIMNECAAIATSATYAVLSLSSSVFGFAAHATHFIVILVLSGLFLLLKAVEKNKLSLYLWSGILLGTAIVVKQSGLFFFLFGIFSVILSCFSFRPIDHKRSLLKFVFFTVGGLIPLFITVAILYLTGVFNKFWFWTIQYASKYSSQIPLHLAFGNFKSEFLSVIDGFYLLWILSALGLILLFFHPRLKLNKSFILLFSFFSFLTVCPGFYFRPHYFITLLPAVSICVGISIDYFHIKFTPQKNHEKLKLFALGIFLIAALIGIFNQKEFMFTENPVKLSRAVYGLNPFPESISAAEFINSRTAPNDPIVVFGSEPQIYFYSKRRSGTGYIYTYNLMENHEYSLTMQKDMIKEIKSSNPKYIIFVVAASSWLRHEYSENYIFSWFNSYTKNDYELVGVIDIISKNKTVYKWYKEAKSYKTQSPYFMQILERKDSKSVKDKT